MRSLLLTAVLLPLVFTITACDPIRNVRGTVHAAPTVHLEDDQPVYEKGEPIQGAKINYLCGRTRILTDEEGHFEYEDIGYWQPDCSFHVSHEDYYPQIFRVDELCAPTQHGNCFFMSIQAELLPRGPESAGADEPSHQLDAQTVPPAEWPSPTPLYRRLGPTEYVYFSLVAQSAIFLSAFPTRWTGGAYFMGGLWVFYGVYAGFLPTYFDGWQKAVALTPALSLFALATYNFAFANTHSPRRKFWTNVGGLNVAALSLGITVLALTWNRDDPRGQSDSTLSNDLEFGFTGTGVQLRYRF